jgi:hypothetical protein
MRFLNFLHLFPLQETIERTTLTQTIFQTLSLPVRCGGLYPRRDRLVADLP